MLRLRETRSSTWVGIRRMIESFPIVLARIGPTWSSTISAVAPDGMHRGVGSQLIYNRQTKQSLFLGALTSDRFLTLLRLKAEGKGADAKIASYNVDSTGTTEIQKD